MWYQTVAFVGVAGRQIAEIEQRRVKVDQSNRLFTFDGVVLGFFTYVRLSCLTCRTSGGVRLESLTYESDNPATRCESSISPKLNVTIELRVQDRHS